MSLRVPMVLLSFSKLHWKVVYRGISRPCISSSRFQLLCSKGMQWLSWVVLVLVGMTPTEEGMAGRGARPHRRNKRLCVINKRPLCYIENAML